MTSRFLEDLEGIKVKDLRDILKEECGLAAAINIPLASRVVRDMLMGLQHRGEKSVGIASSNHHRIELRKRMGRVDDEFYNYDFSRLPGKVAIGHNRYATKGSADDKSNIQPFGVNTKYGFSAWAHNGTLMDVNGIKRKLLDGGAVFQSSTDSEILIHLIAQSKKKTLEEAIQSEITKVPTAYSQIIMTKHKLIALRDKYGVRPLSIAKMGRGYLVASETSAFRLFPQAEFVREIKPGEMVVFDKKSIMQGKGFKSIQFSNPDEHFCSFECIYFSEPHSEYNGYMHDDFREICGVKIYEENKEFFEELKAEHGDNVVIVPILDSGKHGGIGLQKASGIPYKEYFLRRHNVPKKGRSFTASKQKERSDIAYMKLDLRKRKIPGKVVITVDDSEVRGTTAIKYNERLRKAGAKKIINVMVSPKIVDPCYMGMDYQTHKELIAYIYKTEKTIAEKTGSDKTIFLSLGGLNEIVDETYKCGMCFGCFGGQYPVKKKYLNRNGKK